MGSEIDLDFVVNIKEFRMMPHLIGNNRNFTDKAKGFDKITKLEVFL